MRFLIVVPPLAGHISPTVAVGQELIGRGHEVAWCGPLAALDRQLTPELERFAAPRTVPGAVDAVEVQRSQRRGAAAMKETITLLTVLADVMLPDVRDAIDAWQPDVVVVDQHAFAGAIAARERGARWATSAAVTFEFEQTLVGMSKVGAWIRGQLIDLQVRSGVPHDLAEAGDLRFSEHLVLGFTTREMLIHDGPWPDHYVFVGPSIGTASATGDFPWEWLDDGRPCVLVTLGTVNAEIGGRFYEAAVEALAGLDVQGVVVAPAGIVPEVPDNVLVVDWVPWIELLDRVHAVVCHGGQNTVAGALAKGLPSVVAPIRDDQSQVAAQVAAAGAGVRVKFGRVTADRLRAAITEVLGDSGYAAAAGRLATSFAEAGGAQRAATELERLAAST